MKIKFFSKNCFVRWNKIQSLIYRKMFLKLNFLLCLNKFENVLLCSEKFSPIECSIGIIFLQKLSWIEKRHLISIKYVNLMYLLKSFICTMYFPQPFKGASEAWRSKFSNIWVQLILNKKFSHDSLK